jgi:hypothetical protein
VEARAEARTENEEDFVETRSSGEVADRELIEPGLTPDESAGLNSRRTNDAWTAVSQLAGRRRTGIARWGSSRPVAGRTPGSARSS